MERLYEGILGLTLCSDYARMILNAVKPENRSIAYKELSLRYPFLIKKIKKQTISGRNIWAFISR